MRIQLQLMCGGFVKKIEEDPAKPVYLKNIRGLGYVWNQEVG